MQFVKNMLSEQRKRLLGSLMKYLEDNVYDGLSETQQRALRQKVLQAVNQHHDVCLDLLKSSLDTGETIINDEAIRLITSMHSDLQAMRRGQDG